jgi:nicotinamidase-related amidase
MAMKNTALLLIDIQNDYFAGGALPLVGSEAAVKKAKQVLLAFRAMSWPVFCIQHLALRPGSTFFLPGTGGADIHPEILPLPGESLIVKHYPNSFRETHLLKGLQEKDVSNLVICGMMTHMCVDATVRAARDLNFTVELIEDACATRDLQIKGRSIPADIMHHSFLAALDGFYARIISAHAWCRAIHA